MSSSTEQHKPKRPRIIRLKLRAKEESKKNKLNVGMIYERLRNSDTEEAVEYAEAVVKPQLLNLAKASAIAVQAGESALYKTLDGIYAVFRSFRGKDAGRRVAILKAFGCKAKPEKVALSLLNTLLGMPLDQAERRRVQNRHSTYARAMEEMKLQKVAPADFLRTLKNKSGGLEGFAEEARERDRLKKKEREEGQHRDTSNGILKDAERKVRSLSSEPNSPLRNNPEADRKKPGGDVTKSGSQSGPRISIRRGIRESIGMQDGEMIAILSGSASARKVRVLAFQGIPEITGTTKEQFLREIMRMLNMK